MVSWGERSPAEAPQETRKSGREPAGPRPIVGFIYETVLDGQEPGTHSYVGKVMGSTPAAVTARVHGRSSSAHTSPESVRRDPWKARILPGTRGYRILERVRDEGDPRANDLSVRRAEAFWIDRLRPLHNDVRPVRPPSTETQPRRPSAALVADRRRKSEVERSRRSARPVALLVLMTVASVAVGLAVGALRLPWPVAPWIAGPVVGAWIGWRIFLVTVIAMERTRRQVRKVRRLLR